MSRLMDAVRVLMGKTKAIDPFDIPKMSNLFDDIGGGYTGAHQQMKAYIQMAWVAVAVDHIVRDTANQEYYFCDTSGKIIDPKRLPKELLKPFENQFFGIGFRDILRMVIAHRILTGNGFIYMAKSNALSLKNGLPDVFVPIIPDWLYVRSNQGQIGINQFIINFPNGQSMTTDPSEMMHFKQNTIFDPWWGVSNITKMRLLVEGEVAAATFKNEFMKRKASPSLAVTDESERSPDDIDRIMELIRSKFEGAQNAGKAIYANGKGIKIQGLTMSYADMEYMAQKEFDRQTTLSIFGVPPIIAGIPESTIKSNGVTMRTGYLEDTCNRTLAEIEETFNQSFVNRFFPDIRFKLQQHKTGEVDRVSKMIASGIITPNRGAELIGEEFDLNNDLRNQFYLPSNLIPIGSEITNQDSQTNDDESKKKHQNLTNPKNVDAICDFFIKSATEPKKFQVKYIRASLKSRAIVEEKNVKKLSDFFIRQKERVLENLRQYNSKSVKKEDLSGETIYSLGIEGDLLEREMRGIYTSGVQRAVDDINKITGSSVNLNTSNPFIAKAISNLGRRITTGLTDRNGNKISVAENTLSELQGIIEKSVNESWGINELQDAISDKFDQWQSYRARMIARTESRAAWDAGAKVAYQEIGVKEVDIVGCTMFEPDSDCGAQNIPVEKIDTLSFHPNHIGVPAPSEE